MENVEIKNLSFTYPNENKPALQDVNLCIKSGEFITIFGKSGCGKSTLLRNLKPPVAPIGNREGVVLFGGRNIYELSYREQTEEIGFVAQSADNAIVTDKVWHELAFGLESLGFSGDEIRVRVAETASFFGITDWFYKKTTELSGGQKQLLNLASVMVMQPSVLILDEPTAQLDPIAARQFLETVARVNRELGTTVILTEHRLEETFTMSDRVVFIENGKISACGAPREVSKNVLTSSNDIADALPTAPRIYYAAENGDEPPLTVREGRAWLSRQKIVGQVCEEEEEKNRDAALWINDIWFRYEKNLPDVIKGLSLEVGTGEIYAILGGNGAGKSTMLSIVAGGLMPYRGKIQTFGKKISALAQNPKNLLEGKTVLEDLEEMIPKNAEERDFEIKRAVDFCELEHLLKRHPHDLSGGEQQRAALAKVLLSKPDIILLDEPTKGLDACFKKKLAALLKGLAKSGRSIILVSHDIEFCAKYADRCGMFFDGQIVSEGTPRKFFERNNYYTTAASRMSRGIIENAVLEKDIIRALGKEISEEKPIIEKEYTPPEEKIACTIKKKKKLSRKRIVSGSVCMAAFAAACALQMADLFAKNAFGLMLMQALSVLELALGLSLFFPHEKKERRADLKKKGRLSGRTFVALFFVLVAVPLTIFCGIHFFGDRKYYFISMLIIFETLILFAMVFEGRKPQARELVIISVLCAAATAGRTAFYMLPQFKPVLAIVIISGVCFGGETGFLVGAVTGFVSNFFFGQGPWTPWHMFSFGIIGFIAGILFEKGFLGKQRLSLCIFGFLATFFIYGGIMNPASAIMSGVRLNLPVLVSYYAMGAPLDLIHAASTAFFLWFISEPMIEKLERIKTKYGLI